MFYSLCISDHVTCEALNIKHHFLLRCDIKSSTQLQTFCRNVLLPTSRWRTAATPQMDTYGTTLKMDKAVPLKCWYLPTKAYSIISPKRVTLK